MLTHASRPVGQSPLRARRQGDVVMPPVPSLPRFLRAPLPPHALAARRNSGMEQEADRVAQGGSGARVVARPHNDSRPATLLDRALVAETRRAPAGRGLPTDVRPRMEARLSADLSGVRVHTDPQSGRLADSIGANAFSVGRDVYFGTGRYQPQTTDGDRILTHELVHSVQHGGDDGTHVDADLAMSLPTALGGFEIDMQDRVAPARPGMEGHIRFLPDASGPYSAEIGLIQAVRIEAGGATSGVGSPLGFAGPGESERDILATTGSGLETPGWHVDTTYADPAKTPGSAVSPSYPESVGLGPGDNEHGWLRSPTDIKAASLYDYPGSSRPQIRFDFETVAKGLDNQNVYGALHWGFEILAGVPTSEFVFTMAATSREFDISLERFRAFFTHEPVILYFDTGVDMPAAGEGGKLGEAVSWLARFSDAHVEIEGFADERGSAGHNRDLSRRRADSVAALLMSMGIDAGRIDSVRGRGETDAFAAGSDAGTFRANRRVRIRFVRNATTPPGP